MSIESTNSVPKNCQKNSSSNYRHEYYLLFFISTIARRTLIHAVCQYLMLKICSQDSFSLIKNNINIKLNLSINLSHIIVVIRWPFSVCLDIINNLIPTSTLTLLFTKLKKSFTYKGHYNSKVHT